MAADPPDSTQQQRRTVREHVVTTLRAEVVDGPDRGKHATSTEALSVGTAKDNALVLSDHTVSRYHLEVLVGQGGVALADLGSTNGTYAGAVRVERAIVPPGTLVKLGATTIRFDDAERRSVPIDDGAGELAGLRGRSPRMRRVFAELARVAATLSPVLIVGESGTGKERVAEAIHARSPRAHARLVRVDSNEAGVADRLEPAHGGTLFLDELGELTAADQVALLGALERRRFDLRVIAASSRDLRADVNSGRFRADLYHRLAVVVLRLPPLRERREDIALLVEHFARELGAEGAIESVFPMELLARWQRHPWPGNVRELRNAVEAAIVVGAPADDDRADALPAYKDARAQVVTEFERTYLARLVREAGGNVSAAARAAKMDRSHLIELLERHGLK